MALMDSKNYPNAASPSSPNMTRRRRRSLRFASPNRLAAALFETTYLDV
jgi:hypothetical protein